MRAWNIIPEYCENKYEKGEPVTVGLTVDMLLQSYRHPLNKWKNMYQHKE